MGPAASNLLQGRPKPWQDTKGQVGLSEYRYQDPTWRKGHQDGGNVRAAVSDGKFRSPPQVRYHPQQDYP